MHNWISTRCKLGTHAICPGFIGQVVCFCECHQQKHKEPPTLAELLPTTAELLDKMNNLDLESTVRKWLTPMRKAGVERWN